MKLSSKIKTAAMAIALVVLGAGAAVLPTFALENTNGTTTIPNTGINGGTGMVSNKANLEDKDLTSVAGNVINIILYVVGALAVIMVIIGGIQYTTSAGDQNKVTKAKNTILYGVVGLAIAVLAYAIVNFVIGIV